jgi:hypothetical protein
MKKFGKLLLLTTFAALLALMLAACSPTDGICETCDSEPCVCESTTNGVKENGDDDDDEGEEIIIIGDEVTEAEFEQFIQATVVRILEWSGPLQFSYEGYFEDMFVRSTGAYCQNFAKRWEGEWYYDEWTAYAENDDGIVTRYRYDDGWLSEILNDTWWYPYSIPRGIWMGAGEAILETIGVMLLSDIVGAFSKFEFVGGAYVGSISFEDEIVELSIRFVDGMVVEIVFDFIDIDDFDGKLTLGYENTPVVIPQEIIDTAVPL